jgi:hypothetical protein
MLQEYFKKNGFNTCALIGGFPLTLGNLDKGFDVFEYKPTLNDKIEGRGEFSPANDLITRAINWFEGNKGKNNFMFIHFF